MNHIRQTLLYAGMAWVAGMCFSLTASAQAPDEAPAKEKKAKPAAGKGSGGAKRPAVKRPGMPGSRSTSRRRKTPWLRPCWPRTRRRRRRSSARRRLLLEAGRPELAKRFLKKLLDAKLDDGQWTALVDEFHTAAFTDLAGRTELRPESEDVDPRGPECRQSPLARPGPHRRADQAVAGPVARSPRTGPGEPASARTARARMP